MRKALVQAFQPERISLELLRTSCSRAANENALKKGLQL